MKSLPLPSQEYLEQALRYDAETGKLFWRERPASHFRPGDKQSPSLKAHNWNALFSGKEACCTPTANGYLKGAIDGRYVLAHRVIWKLVHGVDPVQIDHINGDRADNRLANLRSVTCSENNRNRRLPISNNSGFIGVCWSEQQGAWMAYIRLHLGYFDSLEDAVAARQEAQADLGYHLNHGVSAHPGQNCLHVQLVGGPRR